MDDFRFKKIEDMTTPPPSEYPGTNMLDYPYPLRPDTMVHLCLPRDLTAKEVMRIHRYLLAICGAE